eukprot:CAMPEP_0113636110 /NCGR_PEP_ID=MMETSP0017_2-20120614/18844_1 /TAXON_ID=2856 /ORGANISM="Cylindrotheca closterium" /LENGTH=93 /DNA_ID=CAMNT_0000546961 /DNA_START=301 /DNA_END=582 /DNA_ORIENTATION=+ /assembly_acc=CAM_ASM_000147
MTLRSMTTIGENLKAKERFEETRFMKKQDAMNLDKMKQMKELKIEEEEHMRGEALHREVVEPVMKDAAKILEETGDSVSDAALENLSKWKLDL